MLYKHPTPCHLCQSISLNFIYIAVYILSHTSVLSQIKCTYQQVNLSFCTFSQSNSSKFLSLVTHFFPFPFSSVSVPFSLSNLAGIFTVGNEDWHRYSKINCFLTTPPKDTYTHTHTHTHTHTKARICKQTGTLTYGDLPLHSSQ